MSERHIITKEGLERLFDAITGNGHRILAPREIEGRIDIASVKHVSEVALDALQAIQSAKETVFPRVERLLSYTLRPGQVDLQNAEVRAENTVLFGIRPCEAMGFGSLDAVFNWDYKDTFFNERKAKLAVIGVSCTRADDACFCTSVGGGPGSTAGSDILLTPLGDGKFLAEVLTEKGAALKAKAPDVFTPDASTDKEGHLAKLPAAFDHKALAKKLGGMFEHELWAEQSLRCIGCGACAFVCPTCACFDIQEEADTRKGERLRCWDSCGFHMFTLHASGHNPRENQGARWRQRVYHKLKYFPDRFGSPMCVGCGKCTRACPVDMNLRDHLTEAANA